MYKTSLEIYAFNIQEGKKLKYLMQYRVSMRLVKDKKSSVDQISPTMGIHTLSSQKVQLLISWLKIKNSS